jgi:hypothetical protein
MAGLPHRVGGARRVGLGEMEPGQRHLIAEHLIERPTGISGSHILITHPAHVSALLILIVWREGAKPDV